MALPAVKGSAAVLRYLHFTVVMNPGRKLAHYTAYNMDGARFANALGADSTGIAPLVRTKLLVLAWAYDRTYGVSFLPRIEREPEGFGRIELSATG